MADKDRLKITNKIASGRNGIKVCEGTSSTGIKVCEGTWITRKVAVKCIPLIHKEKAVHEIQAYKQYDSGPNILRCHDETEDEDFCYVMLQEANCNLYELIQSFKKDKKGGSFPQKGKRAEFLKKAPKKFGLWHGYCVPSPLLIKLIR